MVKKKNIDKKYIIPSASEAKKMSEDILYDKEYVWDLIHDKLAEIITDAIKSGYQCAILNKNNFFGWHETSSLFYKVFTEEFIDMLTSDKMPFKYTIECQDYDYYVIYW